jgi:tRNA nucleotidyltransferase (CCA-adding enzyme)
MSLAVEKLWSFLGVENLVVLVKVGERIYFTIRSRHMNLDLNGLGGSLRNGGGAFTMGYFEDSDFEKANLAIRRAFEKNIERLIKVRDIMSSPVRTVLTEMRIEDVLKIMQRTGHHTHAGGR